MKIDMIKWNEAIKLIEHTIERKIHGVKYEIKETTTNSWEAFKKEISQGNFYVSAENCENTIYSKPEMNIKARVWHDLIHLSEDLSFSLFDEILVCNFQMDDVEEVGKQFNYPEETIVLARSIIYTDIVKQAEYYSSKGKFIAHQKSFVQNHIFNYVFN